MRKKIYLVVGASGSGKDYIVDKLCEKFDMKKVISRTTREPRYKDEATHIFVTNEQADKEFGYAIAKTIYNGNRYYTLIEDLVKADFYIIDPKGVYSINDDILEQFSYEIIYIKTSWWTRFKNMKKRGDKDSVIWERVKHDANAFIGIDKLSDFIIDGGKEDAWKTVANIIEKCEKVQI